MSDKNSGAMEGIFKQGYGLIPKLVMRDKDISAEAKAIYAYLSSFTGAGRTAYPSISLMASELNMSENRFYNHRKQLLDKGYIKISKRRNEGGWSNNLYTLTVKPHLQNEGIQNEGIQNEGIQNEGTITNSSITNSSKSNSSKSVEQSSQSDKSDAIPYLEIIEHLNKKTGKSIKHTANGNRRLIRARWNEGYTLEDFKKVIDNKSSEWMGVVFTRDGKSVPAENYLHPATLFIPKNFDRYLNEQQVTNDKKNPNGYSDTGALLDSFGSSYK